MKHVVITGGTGGLGRALHAEFSGHGWTVTAVGRTAWEGFQPAAIRRYFDEYPCDLLVCAAGIIRDRPLAKMPERDWDEVMHVNCGLASRVAEAAIPGMRSRGSGHVVFVSSYAALHPADGQAAYATAKACLHGYARDLAQEHGDAGLRFNVVLPGFMETAMTDSVSPQRREEVLSAHVLRRFNTPAHSARFIRFLEESMPHTSGQLFSLDSRL